MKARLTAMRQGMRPTFFPFSHVPRLFTVLSMVAHLCIHLQHVFDVVHGCHLYDLAIVL